MNLSEKYPFFSPKKPVPNSAWRCQMATGYISLPRTRIVILISPIDFSGHFECTLKISSKSVHRESLC